MRTVFTIIAIYMASFSVSAQEVFKTSKSAVSININDVVASRKWTINPDLEVDVFYADCPQKENEVTFLDGVDSISFTVGINDTIDFYILSAEKNRAMTRIIGVEPNVTFTDEYIAKYKNEVFVDIPEVSELVNILIALHKDIEKDKNMVNSETVYYQEVKKHFAPYQDHPIMDTIQKYISEMKYIEEADVSIFNEEGYYYYYALKMNACAYQFGADGKIKNEGYIKRITDGWNPFDPMKDLALIEDFAQKSNFQAFYKGKRAYYDDVINTYSTLNPIHQMQDWLDTKFGFSYGNYTIYFSPLIGGAHSTKGFETADFKQTFMFICPAERNEEYSPIINELLESRVVFTEIDHNYVNPVSARYNEELEAIFSKRETWIKGEMSSSYNSPFMLFNEYMTFGIYSLYLHDNYQEEDVLEYLPMMEQQMAEQRGFYKFKEFNRAMLSKYQADTSISIENLYDYMIDWSEKQL